MFKNLSGTDFARAITQNFGDQSVGVRETFPRLHIKFGCILFVVTSLFSSV
jgi:hypothetical protein